MDEKAIKKQVLAEAGKHPEKYFPVKILKSKGFERHQCSKCKRYFWSIKKLPENDKKEQVISNSTFGYYQSKLQDKSKSGIKPLNVCGDPACSGGFRFIGNSPAKKKLDYIETWKEFVRIHKKLGYTPIKRYPVVARWNPTVDFTIADIAAFQPYVVSGEIAPPANPLVIPQFCLRFADIDNVGITGHHVGFVMMGEKEFVPPQKYDVERYMKDHLTWLTDGMGLPLDEITIHEDVWAGGGNLGPCMEFFSRGLEISNQVYMQYEITPDGLKDLKLKVLDMGQGMERVPWFTSGSASIYECSFPTVIKKMREITGVEYDEKFMQKFTPLAPYLNTGEVEDIEGAWKHVAKQMGMDVKALKDKILPLAGLYAVAEHTRALLFAINDGGLPSNVGGMYNLRVILRRALGFIDKYKWKLSLPEIAKWHADYLEPLFPELQENLYNVAEILEVEKKKYEATRQKTQSMLPKLLEKKLTTEELVTLYDSQGISPELLAEEAAKQGKTIKVPDGFYALVAERHAEKEQEHATERVEKVSIKQDIPATKALYFEDYAKSSFDAKVLQVTDKFVILDQTLFYPVSGGQIADQGTLDSTKVIDVFKQGAHIVHVCSEIPHLKVGQKVHGEIDFDRRMQLAQHHTATHIVNAAARKVLGAHVNQAGAKKDIDKAHIDITHYEALTEEQLEKIEKEANSIVKKGIKTSLSFVPREEAEKKYGMAIYQGGAVPGKLLRIVNIPDIDVEACGGTHLKNTSETGNIKILKASKIKDGIVRIVFTAGEAAKQVENKEKEILDKAASLLKCRVHQIPGRARELFEKWKKARKGQTIDKNLTSKEEYKGNVLAKTAEILQTQPEVIIKTIERFLKGI